ncbi:MAG TPA: hypothetical protein VGQ61_09115, partial [Candidatus Angelobacter sp.]|nr:hypothetical protein [Candidatus Angelobacter sp.]
LLEILPAIKAEVPSPSASNFLQHLQVSETYCPGLGLINLGEIAPFIPLAHKSHFQLRRFVS